MRRADPLRNNPSYAAVLIANAGSDRPRQRCIVPLTAPRVALATDSLLQVGRIPISLHFDARDGALDVAQFLACQNRLLPRQ